MRVPLQKSKPGQALLAGLLLAVALLPGLAMAESAINPSVDATVGIHPMLTLTCSPVNLGVWRVPPRTTGGTTRIMLDIDHPELGTQVYLNTKVAKAQAYADWDADFGTCTLTQSRALDQSSATIKIANNRLLKVDPADLSFTNINRGRSGSSIRVDVYVPTLVKIMNGTATFKVGGGLTIPQKIEFVDHGAYRTSIRPMITVDDRMRD